MKIEKAEFYEEQDGVISCEKCGIYGDFQGGGIDVDGVFYAHLYGLGEGNMEYALCTECLNKEEL